MSTRRFENFGQRLTAGIPDVSAVEVLDPENPHTPPVEPEAEPEEPTTPEPEEDQEMPDVNSEDYKAGVTAGIAEANTRMSAVFASEHFPGREASAAKMLAKPNMTASDITDLLADMPKASPVDQSAANAAAEVAAREEMRAAMNENNVDLGADQPAPDKSGKAKSDAVWDKANAKVGRVSKEG